MSTYTAVAGQNTFSLVTGDIINFPYVGAASYLILPKGIYKLETWGAEGGADYDSKNDTGKGGYSVGTITLSNSSTIYSYSGGQGSTGLKKSISTGGFNGGGNGTYYYGGAGGGASDIRINTDSLYARVIVAGAGGGSGNYADGDDGGAGGGTSGTDSTGGQSSYVARCGTQTSGGTGGGRGTSYIGESGVFGLGGAAHTGQSTSNCGGGGGAGWYGGGGAGYYSNLFSGKYNSGGGGGSGYVYTSSTASSYPTGCLLTSEYYLADASTTAGTSSFLSPTGTSETGHSGNGYCRITVISISGLPLFTKIDGTWKEVSEGFVKIDGVWKNISLASLRLTDYWTNIT